jgi:hypothetical protein
MATKPQPPAPPEPKEEEKSSPDSLREALENVKAWADEALDLLDQEE